jgi:hypothetical protein
MHCRHRPETLPTRDGSLQDSEVVGDYVPPDAGACRHQTRPQARRDERPRRYCPGTRCTAPAGELDVSHVVSLRDLLQLPW